MLGQRAGPNAGCSMGAVGWATDSYSAKPSLLLKIVHLCRRELKIMFSGWSRRPHRPNPIDNPPTSPYPAASLTNREIRKNVPPSLYALEAQKVQDCLSVQGDTVADQRHAIHTLEYLMSCHQRVRVVRQDKQTPCVTGLVHLNGAVDCVITRTNLRHPHT